ncbi:MAG: zinc ribbon domain-containing protein [Promethearchaeota archaeon]
MKHKLGIILLLTFMIVVPAPAIMAASIPLEYSGEVKDEGYTFDVEADFRLIVTCSDNWRYWPGLTSDTLTVKLELNSLELSRNEKTYSFPEGLGTMGKNQFRSEEWTTEEYNYLYGYYETHDWKRDYYAHLEGMALGSIEYSGAISSINPTELLWETSASQTATVYTRTALLGSASIKVRVDEYRLRLKIATETYRDGLHYSSDSGSWSKWFTIGSPSNYVELNMANMGVSLFLVITAIVVVVVVVVFFFTKRKIEIVSPEDMETGRLIMPTEEGPPADEKGPLTEEVGPPKTEKVETPAKEKVETTGNPCPFCGGLNPPAAKYCIDCGAQLD